MAFIDDLKSKNKAELEELAEEWGATVTDGATKDELLEALVRTGEAERQNLAHNAGRMIADQCEARGIPEDELDEVHAHIESEFGSPVSEMSLPDINRMTRGIDGVMRGYLGGHKRRDAGRRPAGLTL